MRKIRNIASDTILLVAFAQATYGLVLLGRDLVSAAAEKLKK